MSKIKENPNERAARPRRQASPARQLPQKPEYDRTIPGTRFHENEELKSLETNEDEQRKVVNNLEDNAQSIGSRTIEAGSDQSMDVNEGLEAGDNNEDDINS